MATLPNAHALVVGIDAYADPDVPSLPPAVRRDAEDVAALLRDPARCGYPPANVPDPLIGAAATRDAVRKALDDLTARCDADSTAFLYFSCHGARMAEGEYLLPADAKAFAVPQTAIPAAEFSDRVAKVPARRLVVVLDCCHAAGVAALKGGPPLRFGLGDDLNTRLHSGGNAGRVVFAACAPDEKSVVVPADARNSLFTAHLLEGLRGKAADDDGFVKVFGLFEYASLRVTGQWRDQHPVFKADLKANFAVASNAANERGVCARDPQQQYLYDAFVAHAGPDFDWVFDHLVPVLDREGLRHTFSDAPAQFRVTAVEDAVRRSKYVLAVVSPAFTADRLAKLAGVLGLTHGLQAGAHNVIPVRIGEPAADVGLALEALVGVDLAATGRRYEYELGKLIRQLHQPPSAW